MRNTLSDVSRSVTRASTRGCTDGRLYPTEGRDIRGLSQLAYLGYGLVRRPTGMIPVPVDGTSRDTESRFRPTRRDLGTE